MSDGLVPARIDSHSKESSLVKTLKHAATICTSMESVGDPMNVYIGLSVAQCLRATGGDLQSNVPLAVAPYLCCG